MAALPLPPSGICIYRRRFFPPALAAVMIPSRRDFLVKSTPLWEWKSLRAALFADKSRFRFHAKAHEILLLTTKAAEQSKKKNTLSIVCSCFLDSK